MIKIVDLFCGIGGVPEAARDLDDMAVVAAIDIDQASNTVYRLNHGIEPRCQTLESIRELPRGDLVWLSPPCQPYTRRGRKLAEQDPRSEALSNLIQLLDRSTPDMLILENVPEFENSRHHFEIEASLNRNGLATSHQVLCPTQWGVPMRRRRFYLRAKRTSERIAPLAPQRRDAELVDYLEEAAWTDERLQVADIIRQRYSSAMDIVDANDPHSIASCFTAAYGDSPVRSGSYLECRHRMQCRRFSPREIANLLGYRTNYRWPAEFSLRQRYRMLGNALSVQVTRALLESMLR